MANFGKKRRFDEGGAAWDESYRSLSANSGGINQPNTTSGRNASPKVRKKLDDTKARVDKGASMKTFKDKQGPALKVGKIGDTQGPALKVGKVGEKQGAGMKVGKIGAKQDMPQPKKTFGPRISEKAKLERLRATRAALASDKSAGGKTDREPPKAASQPSSTSNGGKRNNKPTKIVSQGNWTNAAPAKKPKSLQEAVRGADAGSGYMRDKMRPKKSLFGKSASTAKTTKTSAKKKGLTQNWFTAQMQGRNTK